MKYNPKLGVFGNIKALYSERNKTNNTVFNNKAEAEQANAASVDGLIEVAGIASDSTDAMAELGEMVSTLYDAVAELGEIIAER